MPETLKCENIGERYCQLGMIDPLKGVVETVAYVFQASMIWMIDVILLMKSSTSAVIKVATSLVKTPEEGAKSAAEFRKEAYYLAKMAFVFPVVSAVSYFHAASRASLVQEAYAPQIGGAESEELQGLRAELQTIRENHDVVKGQLGRAIEANAELRSKLENEIRAQLVKYDAPLRKLTCQNVVQAREMERLNSICDELITMNSSLRKDLEDANNELNALNKRNGSREIELERLQKKNQASLSEIEELEKTIEGLNRSLQEAREMRTEADKKLAELRERKEANPGEIEKQNQTIKELTILYNGARSREQKAQAELTELREENEKLKNQIIVLNRQLAIKFPQDPDSSYDGQGDTSEEQATAPLKGFDSSFDDQGDTSEGRATSPASLTDFNLPLGNDSYTQ